MSIVKIFGKDKVIFATKEDHATPSNVELPPPEPAPGLITNEGEINWSCPCLGGMATGPCGVEFRNAFSCFHYSEAEPKGSDCYEAFRTMQDCFTQYPTVYNKAGGNDDDDDDGEAGGLGGLATMSAAGGGGGGDNSETAADSDKQSAVAAADATAVNVKQ